MSEESSEPFVEDSALVRESARETSVLAAAHAALDPGRRARQADILVESTLRVLASRGQPMAVSEVATGVAKLWRTATVAEPLVREALESARSAQLATTQAVLFGEPEWLPTDAALRDLIEDSAWAQAVIDRFDHEAMERLEDDPNRPLLKVERLPSLVARVRAAIAVGAEWLYGLAPATTPGAMRPIRFNEQSALRAIADVEPRASRQAAERLLIAAIDPDDAFGDDYVNLVVAGNVLHGMVTRRDVAVRPSLGGLRFVLDTSVIVDLAHNNSAQALAVKEGVRLALSAGAQVVVADHTLSEWTRLFDGAEHELGDHTDTTRLGALSVLLQNPFLRAFVSLREQDERLTWARFSSQWRDPRRELEALGVQVRPHGNKTDEDQALVASMATELRRLNRSRGEGNPGARLRANDAINADAETAAMVARWRRERGVDAGFFIARDRMTAEAYRTVVTQDRVPLVITLPAWITMMAALAIEDPSQRPEVAKVIGNAALRDSFLALAASYTLEEVVGFADILCADAPSEPEDVVDFVQTTLEGLEGETQALRAADIKLKGSEVLQHRASRRIQRARRAGQLLEDKLAEERSKAENEKVLAIAQERASSSELIVRKDQSLAAKDVELNLAMDEAARLKRRLQVVWRSLAAVLVLLAASIVVVLLWRDGALDKGNGKTLAVVSLALAGIAGVQFVRVRKLSAWIGWLAGSVVAPILVNLLTR